jgi:Raf kinase inhibitor-like YbhB/YbcL family protein
MLTNPEPNETVATMKRWMAALLGLAAVVLVAPGWAASPLVLTSPSFAAGRPIPKAYTCDGGDPSNPLSPSLRWTAPPAGTRAFGITMDDTDAHFRHWVGWGIAASARALAAGKHPPHEGSNSLGQARYDGPCPQGGGVHHYRFRIYALDKNVAPSLTGVFPKAHVLAVASLVGTYKK